MILTEAQVEIENQIIVWKGSYLNTTEFVKIETGESIAVDGHITGEIRNIIARFL